MSVQDLLAASIDALAHEPDLTPEHTARVVEYASLCALMSPAASLERDMTGLPEKDASA